MKPRNLLIAVAVSVAFLNLACDAMNRITATKIKDILDHPRDYENKEVTVYGTVINSVSLLVVKYFEVQDDTGTIKVVTDHLLPTKGEKLRVTGRMAVIEVGLERWVVLREETGPDNGEKQSKNSDRARNLQDR